MAMMFGRFEILGELSKSETSVIYKATDTETNQTVALKTQNLEPLGERAAAFVDALIVEGESTRDLANQNIAVLYGAGEIDGQFCAAMEYIQGNSIATMLSRKEGFSIWDLLDITRQVCAGLDYAASVGVVHYSLEPAKVMVQWDGLVKILGYGISTMSLIEAESGNGLGRLLPYCSPEQVRGDAMDLRSNLFTWGAVLYEMVTDRKAFDAADPAGLASQIATEMPPPPASLNPKIQPGVSALIMKALAKDPQERYQSARELVNDLEKCKENGKKSTTDAKKSVTAAKTTVSPAARAAAASKFVTAKPAEPERPASIPAAEAVSRAFKEPSPPEPKVAAAAAGAGATMGTGRSFVADSGARLIEEPEEAPPPPMTTKSPVLSTAAIEAEPETPSHTVAVDPIMAGEAPAAGSGRSFSDIDELPPMKEAAFEPPPPPPPVEDLEPPPVVQLRRREEKPKLQAREVAGTAIKEIKTVPPQLMIYSILGAVGIILIVAVALFLHVRSEDEETTAAPRPTKEVASEPQPTASVPPAPAEPATQAPPAPVEEAQPEVTVRQIEKHPRKKVPVPVPVAVTPGLIQVDSTPQGAQIQLDGKSDPSWMTPFVLTGLRPGPHTIYVSRNGFSPESRSVEVVSGSKSFVVVRLSAINALLLVNSTPAGAEIVVDGRNTGRATPAQFAVEKGAHTVLLRKAGYLDETTSADLGPGQNFQFAPTLRALGNADEIRTVGKFKKLFGGNNDVAGMGAVSVRTQPKGAQIAVNGRLLEKLSPTEFMAGPGHYVIDITMTGFKPVHKLVSVDKGGKVAVDEILERQ